MSLPYYKRFPRDFLEGTIGLSFEVKGAYSILLDMIYMRSGRLPDDARFISGQLGCSVRKWTAIKEELLAMGKIQIEGGIISNYRADNLTEESRKYQDKQAEIARNSRKNNDKCQPRVSQSEPEPDTIEDKPSIVITTEKKPDRFDEFWKLYPRKVAKPAAHKSYTKALGKIDHEKLVGHLEQHIASGVWAEAQYGPHATTWLNQERWTDELQSGQGAGVVGRQAPRGGGRENPSFAEIRARRNAGRSDGVEVSGIWSGVQGADHGWSDGAIDGEATIRLLKD